MFRIWIASDVGDLTVEMTKRLRTSLMAEGLELEIKPLEISRINEYNSGAIDELKVGGGIPVDLIIWAVRRWQGNKSIGQIENLKKCLAPKDLPLLILINLEKDKDKALEMAYWGYEIQAFRCLSFDGNERDNYEKLRGAIEAAWRAKANKPKKLILSIQGGIAQIYVTQIVYGQINNRKCEIHLTSGDILTRRGGIKETLLEIQDDRLFQIDKGAFVNMEHIQSLQEGYVCLNQGKRLPVSRRAWIKLKETLEVNNRIGRWNRREV